MLALGELTDFELNGSKHSHISLCSNFTITAYNKTLLVGLRNISQLENCISLSPRQTPAAFPRYNQTDTTFCGVGVQKAEMR